MIDADEDGRPEADEPEDLQDAPAPGTPAADAPLLGRDWIGPALLAAGAVALGRVEVVARLAAARRGLEAEEARWAVLADWPAELVQAGLMAAASAAVIWGAPGKRRPLGVGLALCFLLSALTGWPIAPADTIPTGELPGVPPPALLASAALALSLALAAVALVCRARPGLANALGSHVVIALCALLGIGGPSVLLQRDAADAPRMTRREVVAELGAHPEAFRVASARAAHAPRSAALTPYVDERLNGALGDTGDRLTLVLPPPLEVELVLGPEAEGARLRAAAQLSGRLTDRGLDVPDQERESPLDLAGLDAVGVRFTIALDGAPVFEETIVHRAGDEARERRWRHLGEDGAGVEVAPGQRLTLRTEFADEASRAAFEASGLACGFGDLRLERWSDAPRTRATPETPNLVLVTVDTLRADRLSGYGYRRPTTPNLDLLAREGLVHERAFATSSWTWPSTASLLTGLAPEEHGVLSKASCRLDPVHETLAEALQQRGYTTAAISCNPLVDRARGFGQGFERFDDGAALRKTNQVLSDVLATIDELRDVRFFLYLHLVDPHTPHRPLASELERLGVEGPPEGFPDRVVLGVEVDGLDHYAQQLLFGEHRDARGRPDPEGLVPEEHARWMQDRYDASVGSVDLQLGDVFQHLDELGLDDRTVIAVTSDHGEELLDHGALAHGHDLWRELVHVPLILSGPGVPRGVRVTTPVSNRHLAATLARLGGAELARVTDGIDLLDPDAPGRPVLYQTSKGVVAGLGEVLIQGWRDERFSLHHADAVGRWRQPPISGGETRLYSVEADWGERTNLAPNEAYREEAAARLAELRRLLEERRARRRGLAVGVSEGGLRELRALGYVEDGVPGAAAEGER